MALDDEEVAEIEEIIAAVSEIRGSLNARSREFFDNVEARYSEQGADMYVSRAMWDWLRSLRERA